MLQKIKNINSVAHYEAKLLGRSWFFRIFALIVIGLSSLLTAGFDSIFFFGDMLAVKGVFAYFIIQPLNIIQSIVIIFLAADYLKRDKQLDTSEVFYVRPLSNAEYLIGKMWGTFKSFFLLDIGLLVVMFFLAKYVAKIECSPVDYIIYYSIMVLSTTIFMIGASTGLMLVIGNQALTFVTLLGLSAISLFYVGDYFHNIFDIFVYELPLYKTPIIGYSNIDYIITHQLIYLIAGIGFILISIFLFKRLAGSTKTRPVWLVLGVSVLAVSFFVGMQYYKKSVSSSNVGEEMININNKYINYPKLLVKDYSLDVKHLGKEISSKVKIEGKMIIDGDKVVFSLNSGLKVDSVYSKDGAVLEFDRDRHILIVKLDKEYKKDDKVDFTVVYKGNINEDEMYIDLPEDIIKTRDLIMSQKVEQKSSFVHPKWVILTPESYWYPMSGISYTDSVTNWETKFLSNFEINVTPQDSMVAVSQGAVKMLEDSITYNFKTSKPIRALSLAISDYVKWSCMSGKGKNKVELAAYIHKESVNKFKYLDSIRDTIPQLLENAVGLMERNASVKYDLDRLTVVDAPVSYRSYSRSWSNTQEAMQPELAITEGVGLFNFSLERSFKFMKEAKKKGWFRTTDSESQMMINQVSRLPYTFTSNLGGITVKQGKMGQAQMTRNPNPYYIVSSLFNSQYNIYSEKYAWANKLLEKYVTKDNSSWTDEMERDCNGLSNQERVTNALYEKSLDECLRDESFADINDNVINSLGYHLFGEIRCEMGSDNFKNYLDSLLQKTKFSNFSFDSFIDSLTMRSGVDFQNIIESMDKNITLPQFYIGTMSVEKYRGEESVINVYEITIGNISDVDGYVEMTYNQQYPVIDVIKIKAGETIRLVKHLDVQAWNVNINTMNSGNIPQKEILRIRPGRGFATTLKEEGNFVIDDFSLTEKNEVIVDNEDSELFSVTMPPNTGFYNQWIDKSMENDYKYKGTWGRPPYRWTPIVDTKYYGVAVKSGYRIKGGDGSQKATWRVPTLGEGKYEVHFAATFPEEIQYGYKFKNGRGKPVYNFELGIDDRVETIEVDMREELDRRNMTLTWVWLGDFNIKSDTIDVKLTNKSDLYSIKADAVKIVRVGDYVDENKIRKEREQEDEE